jgi:hypothetical protein
MHRIEMLDTKEMEVQIKMFFFYARLSLDATKSGMVTNPFCLLPVCGEHGDFWEMVILYSR